MIGNFYFDIPSFVRFAVYPVSNAQRLAHGFYLFGSFGACLFVTSGALHLPLDFDVELNLGFRTRRTDRNLRAVFCEVLQYIGSLRHY